MQENRGKRETVEQESKLGENQRAPHFPAIDPLPGTKALLPPSCVAENKALNLSGLQASSIKWGE